MFESLGNYFDVLIIYFPLGIIGLWRWSIWMAKKVTALWYKPIEVAPGYRPRLSVVTPVYNEDPVLFRQALDSWAQNDPQEIIAVIDYTDQKCIGEFQAFSRVFPHARLIVTGKPGKRPALADGIRVATGEILALTDSDTVWDSSIRGKMVAPFNNPKVGGVATRQNVMAAHSLAQRLFDILLDQRYLDEMTYLGAVSNKLTCLSGRTAVYRREALLEVVDGMEKETFAGIPCVSGEDKCLTRLIQQEGWHVRYQRDVRVHTRGVHDIRSLFKQQLRWIRNSWRSDMKSLSSRWLWRDSKILALHMMDRFIQPFTLLLGPIFLVMSIYWHNWTAVAILVLWWFLSRAIKIASHLRYRPSDIALLPVYLLSTYVIAVLKIYALITIRRQGWITRWDKSRLLKISWIRAIPSYLGTAAAVILLIGLIAGYQNVADQYKDELKAKVAVGKEVPSVSPTVRFSFSEEEVNDKRREILDTLDTRRFGTFETVPKDSLWKVSRLLHADVSAVMRANADVLPNPSRVEIGTTVKIPVEELRHPLDKQTVLQSSARSEVVYVPEERAIFVKGEETAIELPVVAKLLTDPTMLEETAPGEWILRVNLFVREGATLIIDGEKVKWLKMKSEDENFAWLRAYDSNILIQNTKITSWDERTNTVDLEHKKDGRSYVLVKRSGRMDVLNSELAYLGYGIEEGYGLTNTHGGGVYGLSWRINDGAFGKYLVTGVVTNTKLHHNYYGLYTYGATGMLIANNEAYENVQYGFDPHDDSNNLIIENNLAHDNGNHGIIISKRCINNTIRGNTSYRNKLHGIMLDRQSNYNLVENNVTYGNVDGVAIYDSHNNLIRHNNIRDNARGVRVNVASSGNLFENNSIINSERGIYFYDGATGNIAIDNIVTGNTIAVYLDSAANNLIARSLYKGQNTRDVKEVGRGENQVQVIKP